jgi:hypothetical protein
MSARKVPGDIIPHWLSLVLTNIMLAACTPAAPPVTPPASYTGPIAEQPLSQDGDYWIYESVSQTRSKTNRLVEQIGFPLWIGKIWKYDSEALLRGQPATSKANRTPTKIECLTVSFTDITVPAGTFKAFQCECKCSVLTLQYDPSCGEWTLWYAPDVKNIVKRQTESTQSSLELIDYRGRPRPPAVKTLPRKSV